MLDELRELYQEVILDHGKRPRNFRACDDSSNRAHGSNPLCGDRLTVFITLDNDSRVADASFVGNGCAISVASASLMTEMIRGKRVEDVETLYRNFHNMCTGEDTAPAGEGLDDDMDRLQVLSGVRQFPVRVKCATLAWHTMTAALHGQDEVTTE